VERERLRLNHWEFFAHRACLDEDSPDSASSPFIVMIFDPVPDVLGNLAAAFFAWF